MKKLIAVLVVALMMAMVAEPAVATLDVEEIYIIPCKEFRYNTVEPSPYEFSVWITGNGITSISVVDPSNVAHVLVDWGDEWGFEDDGFANLTALDASYGPGDYVFTFNAGQVDEDTVTINYQYTEPTSFANITYPANGQTNVSLNPVYTWDSVASYTNADALVMWVVDDPDGPDDFGDDIYEDVPVFDLTTASWQPGPLAPLSEYVFDISVITVQGDLPTETQTDGLDDFDYYGAFEYVNLISFTTGPAIPGDFDSDGDVDGADFGLWQSGYPTASGAALGDGDADGDGDVDGADFGIWQANYPTNVGGTATIPEPATLGLLIMGGLGLLRRRR